jgi:hypothetical protein
MSKENIKKSIVVSGVKNLKEYGYSEVTEDNIITDVVYSGFFKSMLKDNLGQSGNGAVEEVIQELLDEIEANKSEEE